MDFKVLRSLAEEIRCPLCLEFYVNPRVLQCQHSFCGQCLEEMYSKQVNKKILKCPLCREDTNMNNVNNEVKNLAVNLALANIINHLRNNDITRIMSPDITLEMETENMSPNSGVDYSFSAMRRSPSPQISELCYYHAPVKLNFTNAEIKFREWLESLWFVPSTLKENLPSSTKIELQQVPFYLVEFVVESSSKILLEEGNNDSTRMVDREDYHSYSLLVCSSPAEIIRQLSKDIKDWDPYAIEPMIGETKLKEPIELPEAWSSGEVENNAYKAEKERITKLMVKNNNNARVQSVTLNVKFSNIMYTLVYMPMYITTYEYNMKTYQVLISGQTGTVTGQRPYGFGTAGQYVNKIKSWFF